MNKVTTIVLSGIFAFYVSSVYAQYNLEGNSTYPVTASNQGCVVNGFTTFDDLTDETIFANSLLWTINNICTSERENIQEISLAKKSFSFALSLAQETKSKNNYHCNVKLQVGDGRLVFLINDITVESPILMISKTTAFEKLQPEKKKGHKTIIKEFEDLESKVIASIVDYIKTNELKPITHWEEISSGQISKGMNEDECMLAFGKPIGITESNGETQWMYSGSFYIFFKEGVVSSFIK